MEISKDTQEVIDFLDQVSGNKLRKKNDVALIFEIGASFDLFDLVYNIIYTGAGLWNLDRTVKTAKPGTEGIDHVFTEYLKTGKSLRGLLAELRENLDEASCKRFDDIYLPDTGGAFKNLVDLGHDLAEFKKMQNTMKNRKDDPELK